MFTRLVDTNPMESTERVPLRVLDQEDVVLSIKEEISRICDTRAAQTVDEWKSMEKTVLTYGIPDTRHLSPHNFQDMKALIAMVSEAIETFEPRLKNVKLTRKITTPASFSFSLSAEMLVGSTVEPISFPISIQ